MTNFDIIIKKIKDDGLPNVVGLSFTKEEGKQIRDNLDFFQDSHVEYWKNWIMNRIKKS